MKLVRFIVTTLLGIICFLGALVFMGVVCSLMGLFILCGLIVNIVLGY